MDYKQLGEDFRQKYEHTYCRYTSPISGREEVFYVDYVQVSHKELPTLGLVNQRAGELTLRYNGSATLNFDFPPTQYFQHQNKAIMFFRHHERQWKKGICNGTARMLFPYANIQQVWYADLDYNTLESAFKPLKYRTLDEALKELSKDGLSLTLDGQFALGVGNKPDQRWLWFESTIVGEVTDNSIIVHVPEFLQEVKDFASKTYDRRTIVQNSR